MAESLDMEARRDRGPAKPFRLMLHRYGKNKADAENWTVERWRSFGWSIEIMTGFSRSVR